jgi:hypothetical protein
VKESIFGAESAPLVAYLSGLTVIQAVLTVGVALVTRALAIETGTSTLGRQLAALDWPNWLRKLFLPLKQSIVPERRPQASFGVSGAFPLHSLPGCIGLRPLLSTAG